MPVIVRIPQPLQKFTGGEAEVAVEAATAGGLVEALEAAHPGIRDRILDRQGKLNRFINLYLNDEDIRFLGQLDTAVKDGDKVSIVPAIAGGIEPGAPGSVKKNSI